MRGIISTRGDPSRMVRVALLAGELAHWTGGNDFLRLCAGGLWQKQRTSAVRFSFVWAEESSAQRLRRQIVPAKQWLRNATRLKRPVWARVPRLRLDQALDSVSSFGGELNTIVYRGGDGNAGNLGAILERDFDVVLPITSVPARIPIPWVGYIPDLQHKHHPEFFSQRERALRDARFARLLREAKAVIVNSTATKKDLEYFYRGHGCAIFNLPFSPILNPEWIRNEEQGTATRYNLPKRYFLISNQFWVHKSHITAIEALAHLDSDVSIVCTGDTGDYRHPGHLRSLQRRIAELGLTNRVMILGRIPKRDQIEIMRGCVAVLQPTLFEGGPGGGSVYDAVSTGTPVVLSDIPINREIVTDYPSAQFFRAGCAEDLADRITMMLEGCPPRPSAETLQRESDLRADRLATRLLEAIECVLNVSAH